ncbi:hypothetical protein LF01B1_07370 [Limosilactobacillus fermentum]|uniref:Uncharacterized protein n=1 Tax=Limosilactobacillus fermentum TaxID=1613 RepID=A0ABD0AL79_LIMFE|nr:hypothetical protein LF01B1_07370 [Limosilactobacillus fermentum]
MEKWTSEETERRKCKRDKGLVDDGTNNCFCGQCGKVVQMTTYSQGGTATYPQETVDKFGMTC